GAPEVGSLAGPSTACTFAVATSAAFGQLASLECALTVANEHVALTAALSYLSPKIVDFRSISGAARLPAVPFAVRFCVMLVGTGLLADPAFPGENDIDAL